MANPPGIFTKFNGLWVRDHVDDTPPDHFSNSENTFSNKAGITVRDGTSPYSPITDVVRMHLYKPHPPFQGTNIPRLIVLRKNGELIDQLIGKVLHTDTKWKDFALVNFFGRCYISPHDGRIGLENDFVYVYDGKDLRQAGPGLAPTIALTATPRPDGNATDGRSVVSLEVGTYIFSYVWESSTGAITQPAPFATAVTNSTPYPRVVKLENIAVGPLGTVARWIIGTKVVPYPTPYDGNSDALPQYFIKRINDNITTFSISFPEPPGPGIPPPPLVEGILYDIVYFDGSLNNSSDYLRTQLTKISAGCGLIDYKGRMVFYGEFKDPSLVRVSEIGEPEAFSETSGFLITDPSDSTGVRSAVEFRDNLFFYKRHRGYITQDNGLFPSTWQVNNMEKAIGTEPYGIANILDAKGSSSDGYIIATEGGAYYFNGIFQEPELTYKIRDLWLRINNSSFYRIQAANDPVNKRVYFLVPLGSNIEISHVICGDYRNGLDPFSIKWHKWMFPDRPSSILLYEDFSTGPSQLVTRLANTPRIVTLNVDMPGSDEGKAIESFFEFAPVRFSTGISHFNRIRLRATGPVEFGVTVYGQDKRLAHNKSSFKIMSDAPGREYFKKINLVSEQCRLRLSASAHYNVTAVLLEGQHLWDERPA